MDKLQEDNNKLSKRQVSNYAKSNIVGFYDYPKNHPNVKLGNPSNPTQFITNSCTLAIN